MCFLLVDPNEGEPRITVEHPSQMIVAIDPGDRRKRLAALKEWEGEDGTCTPRCTCPTLVQKWQSEDAGARRGETIEWVGARTAPPRCRTRSARCRSCR